MHLDVLRILEIPGLEYFTGGDKLVEGTLLKGKFDFIWLVAEGRITVINNYLQNYQAQSHEGICN